MNGKKLTIITTCLDDWGGSEDLWSRSIDFLEKKHIGQITIIKNKINEQHPEFIRLKQYNVRFKEIDPKLTTLRSLQLKATDLFKRVGNKFGINGYQWNKSVAKVHQILKSETPDLVIVSQGINFDGLAFAAQCLQLNIPYILVSQKAVEFFWPQSGDRAYMRETLIKAKQCFFVSKHNQNLTEEQFGIRLPNSRIALNPVKCQASPLPFPELSSGIKLACVARFLIIDKGQDILLRILSQQKWKDRDVYVSFYGKGPDQEALIELANLLGVKNIDFIGYTDDVQDIWAKHHALILPSRSEGLPLTVIEAMASGRPVITTNQGGSSEVIDDQITGYIAEATKIDLDSVMEIAISQVENWENMGKLASNSIKKKIPINPEKQFANFINQTLNEQ